MIIEQHRNEPAATDFSPPRFSLKYLFIVMTFFALVLAAFSWFANNVATRVPEKQAAEIRAKLNLKN